ncbi:hypothetical protein KUCAC02_022158, partial [Chaenocephalus aceratus]
MKTGYIHPPLELLPWPPRPGVYANLTDQEVIEGRHQGDEQQGHLIHAKKTQDAASRKKVTDFMCHNTSTADRFYATMPDAKEAAVIRTIMAKVLECPPSQSGGGVGSSEEETTSEEDDTVVLYQDSSSGTSSSQDEDFRAELKRRKERRREEDKEGEEAEGEEA